MHKGMKTTEGTFMFVRSQKRHEPKRLSDNRQNFFLHLLFIKFWENTSVWYENYMCRYMLKAKI